jgi:mannose-1-phosphate guanylyltransferase
VQGAWAIVLAAGRGERLAAMVRARTGEDLPKQFVRLYGAQTLLQHTLDRIAPLFAPERTLVVVGAEHLAVAREQTARFGPVRVVGQPQPRGTVAGLLLPLAQVLDSATEPLVAVFPCDHHVQNRRRFLDAVASGLAVAHASPGGVALLGAHGSAASRDLGWIVPGRRTGYAGRPIWSVARFVEKPSPEVARQLADSGALCNTLIVAARARALWQTVARHAPGVSDHFEAHRARLGAADAEASLQETYRLMPEKDLSRDVLQAAAEELEVLVMEGAGWRDCGTPEGLTATRAPEPSAERRSTSGE